MGQKGTGEGSIIASPGKMLRIFYYNVSGERVPVSSGEPDTPEGWESAKRILKELNKRIAAEREFLGNEKPVEPLATPNGPITLRRFCAYAVSERQAFVRDLRTEKTWLKNYVLTSSLADMALRDIRSSHVRDFLTELKTKTRARVALKARHAATGARSHKNRHKSVVGGQPEMRATLSPKTIRNIYGVLRVVFTHAIEERLIEGSANPCAGLGLKRLLGKKNQDADPTWRRKAVFSKQEASWLMGDGRIAESNRILYTAFFYTGMRHGEAAALKWSNIDSTTPTLAALNVWDEKNQNWRVVPIHPTLNAALSEWKLTGWQSTIGRAPLPEDFIFPTGQPTPNRHCAPAGRQRSGQHTLERLHQDLDMLGLRWRRTHDMRRTFLSLSIADGASKDILRWATHAPDSWDIVDKYTSMEWQALCREISKLDLKRVPAPATNLFPITKAEL